MECYGCGEETNRNLTGISVWLDGRRYPAVLCAKCIAIYRQCHECGSPLPHDARADARFCSAACRQRAYRRTLPKKPKPLKPLPAHATGLPPAALPKDPRDYDAQVMAFIRGVLGRDE